MFTTWRRRFRQWRAARRTYAYWQEKFLRLDDADWYRPGPQGGGQPRWRTYRAAHKANRLREGQV